MKNLVDNENSLSKDYLQIFQNKKITLEDILFLEEELKNKNQENKELLKKVNQEKVTIINAKIKLEKEKSEYLKKRQSVKKGFTKKKTNTTITPNKNVKTSHFELIRSPVQNKELFYLKEKSKKLLSEIMKKKIENETLENNFNKLDKEKELLIEANLILEKKGDLKEVKKKEEKFLKIKQKRENGEKIISNSKNKKKQILKNSNNVFNLITYDKNDPEYQNKKNFEKKVFNKTGHFENNVYIGENSTTNFINNVGLKVNLIKVENKKNKAVKNNKKNVQDKSVNLKKQKIKSNKLTKTAEKKKIKKQERNELNETKKNELGKKKNKIKPEKKEEKDQIEITKITGKLEEKKQIKRNNKNFLPNQKKEDDEQTFRNSYKMIVEKQAKIDKSKSSEKELLENKSDKKILDGSDKEFLTLGDKNNIFNFSPHSGKEVNSNDKIKNERIDKENVFKTNEENNNENQKIQVEIGKRNSLFKKEKKIENVNLDEKQNKNISEDNHRINHYYEDNKVKNQNLEYDNINLIEEEKIIYEYSKFEDKGEYEDIKVDFLTDDNINNIFEQRKKTLSNKEISSVLLSNNYFESPQDIKIEQSYNLTENKIINPQNISKVQEDPKNINNFVTFQNNHVKNVIHNKKENFSKVLENDRKKIKNIYMNNIYNRIINQNIEEYIKKKKFFDFDQKVKRDYLDDLYNKNVKKNLKNEYCEKELKKSSRKSSRKNLQKMNKEISETLFIDEEKLKIEKKNTYDENSLEKKSKNKLNFNRLEKNEEYDFEDKFHNKDLKIEDNKINSKKNLIIEDKKKDSKNNFIIESKKKHSKKDLKIEDNKINSNDKLIIEDKKRNSKKDLKTKDKKNDSKKDSKTKDLKKNSKDKLIIEDKKNNTEQDLIREEVIRQYLNFLYQMSVEDIIIYSKQINGQINSKFSKIDSSLNLQKDSIKTSKKSLKSEYEQAMMSKEEQEEEITKNLYTRLYGNPSIEKIETMKKKRPTLQYEYFNVENGLENEANKIKNRFSVTDKNSLIFINDNNFDSSKSNKNDDFDYWEVEEIDPSHYESPDNFIKKNSIHENKDNDEEFSFI